MSDQVTLDLSAEVNRLHEQIRDMARTSLETGMEIGRLLTEQKKALKHGEFGDWCTNNLSFSNATRAGRRFSLRRLQRGNRTVGGTVKREQKTHPERGAEGQIRRAKNHGQDTAT